MKVLLVSNPYCYTHIAKKSLALNNLCNSEMIIQLGALYTKTSKDRKALREFKSSVPFITAFTHQTLSLENVIVAENGNTIPMSTLMATYHIEYSQLNHHYIASLDLDGKLIYTTSSLGTSIHILSDVSTYQMPSGAYQLLNLV